MHYSVDGENRVSYFVEDVEGRFESYDKAKAAGTVSGVELSFFCPRCDAPNAVAYSTPVPEGLGTTCSECGQSHTIFRSSSNSSSNSSPKLYRAKDFERVADKFETKRDVRRVGEAAGMERYKVYKRRKSVANLAGAGIILGGGYLSYEVMLFILGTFSAGGVGLVVGGLLFIAFLVAASKAYHRITDPVLEPYRERFDVSSRNLTRYGSYLRTGARLDDGSSSIDKYGPDDYGTIDTRAETDENDKDVERDVA